MIYAVYEGQLGSYFSVPIYRIKEFKNILDIELTLKPQKFDYVSMFFYKTEFNSEKDALDYIAKMKKEKAVV